MWKRALYALSLLLTTTCLYAQEGFDRYLKFPQDWMGNASRCSVFYFEVMGDSIIQQYACSVDSTIRSDSCTSLGIDFTNFLTNAYLPEMGIVQLPTKFETTETKEEGKFLLRLYYQKSDDSLYLSETYTYKKNDPDGKAVKHTGYFPGGRKSSETNFSYSRKGLLGQAFTRYWSTSGTAIGSVLKRFNNDRKIVLEERLDVFGDVYEKYEWRYNQSRQLIVVAQLRARDIVTHKEYIEYSEDDLIKELRWYDEDGSILGMLTTYVIYLYDNNQRLTEIQILDRKRKLRKGIRLTYN